ncbi:prolipoprotein diacylglyceryl transferase [Dietzia sp.]|uniref:prolipoprotein diacylglyceryl transferase n=1 Tax=Dietzia sp. TaxID=1871616 RepID=UPI002FD8A031
MSTSVLAYIPSPPQGEWNLGPFPIRMYAVCIIIGIIVACWWGERRWRARGGEPGVVLDVAIWAVPFGIIGGRIYHVATDYWRYFGPGKQPLDALKIWDGGLGIWGAVAFGAVGALVGMRAVGIRAVGAFADSIAPPIILAQGIGRLGNYFNQELYGSPTTLPWGLEIYKRIDPETGVTGEYLGHSTGEVVRIVQPTFLYELIWCVLVAVFLVVADRRLRLGHGRVFALYVALYCVGRFVVELLRTDEATMVLGLRINTIVSTLVFLAAIAYFVAMRGRRREDPSELLPVGGERDAKGGAAEVSERSSAQASDGDPARDSASPKGE